MLIVFPQWQGAGGKAMPALFDRGAEVVAERFGDVPRVSIPVSAARDLHVVDGIVARPAIVSNLTKAAHATAGADGPVLMVGGDCSVDLALIASTRDRFGEVGVIYLDAHADLNDPGGSPSGSFHGMVLRHVLGEGDAEVLGLLGSPAPPSHVVLAGARTFDAAESAVLARLGMASAPVEAVDQTVLDRLPAAIHVHLDLDVLDPTEFPHTTWPEAGGPSVATVAALLSAVAATGRLRSVAITECIASRADQVDVLEPILTVLDRWRSGR